MKNIYLFSEIDSSIRETLGKNACEMIDAEPNSLGFVLTQEACAEFYITREIEKDLRGRITAVLDGLCSDAGVKFGESATVSIFASTVVPMPGILEKINGVGLNESVLSTLPDEAAQKAWALHLQLMKAFACEDVSSRHFTDLENEATGKYGVDEIEKLSVGALRELCAAFKSVYAAQGVCSLSTDPYEQFFMSLKTAFRSWDNPRACMYRGLKGITDSGLSIAVQLVDLKTGKHFKNRTTIAAADRNNKEKDASDKSAPQAEFKLLEIDGGDVFEGYFLNKKSTAAENTSGQTAISLTVTGWMASAPAKEESHGQTERHLTVNGRTIRCPKENTPSRTEKYMTAAFRTARRRATASRFSRTAKNMKDSGTTVKSTAAEPTPGQTATPMRVIGRTANAAAEARSSNTAKSQRRVKHM